MASSATSSTAPAGESWVSVGPGRGDYVRETKFRYVGPGPEPGTEDARNKCGQRTCWGASRCRGPGAESRDALTMSHAGPGGGDYIQETKYNYVGAGCGEFALVSDPPRVVAQDDDEGCARLRSRASICLCWACVLAFIVLMGVYMAWFQGAPPQEDIDVIIPTPGNTTPLDRRQCLRQAVRDALAEEKMPAPHKRFNVSLDHSNWGVLGDILKSEPALMEDHGDGNGRAVALVLTTEVHGGLFGQWNEEHPDEAVQKGDHIVKVNNVTGDVSKLLVELGKPQVNNLTMLRADCPDVTTTTTTPPTTTTTTTTREERLFPWQCYNLTDEENRSLASGEHSEEELCLADRADGYVYVYDADDVDPSCGHCWCCRQLKVVNWTRTFGSGDEGYDDFMLSELKAHVDGQTEKARVVAGNTTQRSQVLLRFSSIVGDRLDQVQSKRMVHKATLELNVTAANNGSIEVYKMLREWDPSTTWQELDEGVTPGDEAGAKPLSSMKNLSIGLHSFDVTEAVQDWVDGKDNFGLALMAAADSQDGSFVEFAALGGLPPTLSVTTREVANSLITSTITTTTWTTTTTTTTTVDPTGIKAEWYFHIDSTHRKFEDAIAGHAPDVIQQVDDVDYAAGSSRWDVVDGKSVFGVRWSGQVTITTAGDYTFQVRSNEITTLTIDGTVVWGSDGSSIASQDVMLPMASGNHSIAVTLLRPSMQGEDLMAISLNYEGPDSGGERVIIPEAVLAPIFNAGSGEKKYLTIPLQRKFYMGAPGVVNEGHAAIAVGAGAFLALGSLLALLPSLQIGVQPLLRKWRARAQRRQLRRYDTLAAIVEGGRGGFAPT